ncbi:SDR family NAD(P)-dependent oxidoreductase [Cryobacterium roopkundense]|uniref:SDR family NAD(P)-dependent oxidoreductase n=1 Tax=Cryobacterium roopkundense TaxID=1001240 RepID=UPI001F24CA29|nr:SDR family NAD(P)-dependent oxidoreductase [Cryobacterium roopkundense]
MSWNPRSLPSQVGKTFVVTGANAGLGYFTSEQLAGAGAHVILACRNEARANAALAAIRARVPAASVSFLQLDVSDLQSVRDVSETLRALPRLDGLILNAGIVHPSADRLVSLDGNELIFATNFLGHFALTAGTLMALRRTPGSRVVSLGSVISRLMDSSLDDLQLATTYNGWKAYAQSKIAMQVFGFELDRRLRAERGGYGAVARGAPGVFHLRVDAHHPICQRDHPCQASDRRAAVARGRAEQTAGCLAHRAGGDRPGCPRRRLLRPSFPHPRQTDPPAGHPHVA